MSTTTPGGRPTDPNPPADPQLRRERGLTNRTLKAGILTLIFFVGLLLLFAMAVTLRWIRLPGGSDVATAPTTALILAEDDGSSSVLGGAGLADGAPTAIPGASFGQAVVGPRFAGFYGQRDGLRLLGNPLGPPTFVNGREVQWFERARLEHWPEHAGTPYEVQLGRLGAEYTAGREFSRQTYFGSRPDLRYFPETGHGVGGVFLSFYDRYGGLDTFGYPISEEFDEVLADGRAYRVQYFERARLEYHADLAGTENEVQLGLLGSALYRQDPRPSGVQPAPTPLPMP
jgi:hypothetical protein